METIICPHCQTFYSHQDFFTICTPEEGDLYKIASLLMDGVVSVRKCEYCGGSIHLIDHEAEGVEPCQSNK